MKKTKLSVFVGVIILAHAMGSFAGELGASLTKYNAGVTEAMAGVTNIVIRAYLVDCLAAMDSLKGVDNGSPDLASKLRTFVHAHIRAEQKLNGDDFDEPAKKRESALYAAHLYTNLNMQSLSVIDCQGDLLKRKYFKTETAENANFLEGYANSRCSFTQSHLDATADTKNLGISPEEIIFRFEPALVSPGTSKPASYGQFKTSHCLFE